MGFRIATLVVEFVVAVYLLFAAAKGTSRIFTSPFTKKGMEARYKKTGRIGFVVIGLLVLGLTIINVYALMLEEASPVWETLTTISTTFTFVVLTALLALFFLLNRMHDKQKKNAAPRHVAPRAAFYFDEEENAAPNGDAPAAKGQSKRQA